MTNSFLTKAIKYYYDEGYYTLKSVRGFFERQSNYDKGLLVEGDFQEITGISLDFYETHKDEIGSLKKQAFQAWLKNYKIEHPEEFVA